MNVVVVDDEPYARAKLERLLADEEAEVLAVCANGREAAAAIEQLRPELVFLDIQMPEMDGFEVLRAIAPVHLPEIVFVTAFDQYALRAFEVNALDYLLKPFGQERFHAAFARAEQRLRDHARPDEVMRLLEHLARAPGAAPLPEMHLEWLFVRKGQRVVKLPVPEIHWFEAEGNYVRIHTQGETYLIRERMVALQARLDPKRFARIHRNAIANLSFVREMRPWSNSAFVVLLEDGTELRLSRRYRSRLAATIGEYL
ncbi:MAG TPA: LytTR family DNA-binding domain-containing protein [Longimicrobiaceae bacterium]|nr:LytTR family DNA-binding domain-containing protein [Longimicrobiaceae bacterium]